MSHRTSDSVSTDDTNPNHSDAVSNVDGSNIGNNDDLDNGLVDGDNVPLLSKGTIRRGLSSLQRSMDKKNYTYTRLDSI